MPSIKYSYENFMNPVLQALRSLGGSGTVEEIYNNVTEIVSIPQDQLEILHDPNKGGMTELEYRLMWTRTYLKKYGLIENSSRGVWSLTTKGSTTQKVNEREVSRVVREMSREKKESSVEIEPNSELTKEIAWQEELLATLQNMPPASFERLAQRLLRESGFIQVEVTGRTGDGGIDGHGILRIGGLLSFHVFYQCKRWKGSVGSAQVRDFRGAMVGRADKGIFITTGTFSKDAVKEASRDGAPPIDLVDGDQLVEMLKQLSLGVQTKHIEIEQISIDHEWFMQL